MADIEAATKKGAPFINEMVSATGLTKDQVRHRRAKPVYKEYLKEATNKRRRVSAGSSFLSARGVSRPPPTAAISPISSFASTASGPSQSRDERASPILSHNASLPPPPGPLHLPARDHFPPSYHQLPRQPVQHPWTPRRQLSTRGTESTALLISPGLPGVDDVFDIPSDEPLLPISSSPGPHFSQVAGPSGYVAPSMSKRKRGSSQSPLKFFLGRRPAPHQFRQKTADQ